MAKNEIEGMEILKLIAVAGVVPAKQISSAKKNIPVGEHHVSGLFRIDARIRKGEDVVKPVPASLPMKLMITALLSNMGEAQRKAFIRNFADGKVKVHGYTEKDLASDWEAISSTVTKTTSGATTIKGSIEEVVEV
jgi:hypothetical protein